MSFSDGRTESWATEAEVMAASALYQVNWKVKVKYRGRFVWHTHTFRVENGINAGNVRTNTIPYNSRIHFVYRSNHYNFLLHEPSDLVMTREDKTLTTTDSHHANIDWFELGHTSPKNDDTIDESFDETTPAPWKGNLPGCAAATGDPPLATSAPRAQCEPASAPAPGKTPHPTGGRSASSNIRDKRKRKPEVRSRNRKLTNPLCNVDRTDANGIRQKDKDKKTPNEAKELVTNLSGHTLTNAELSLLEKGLKFVPDRAKINSTKLLAYLGEWERRMRLREYFYKIDDETESESDEVEDGKNKFI